MLWSCASLSAQDASAWGANRYVEYVRGSAPILIAAPHGGDLKPPQVADRTYGVVVQDRRTQEATRELAAAILARTGRRPHVVISHLHRIKLDPNRDVVEAAQGDPFAIQAWNDFHGFCAQARATIENEWGVGLFIDMHGHGHPEGWVELGYVLTSAELALSDLQLMAPTYRDRSSIRALAGRPGLNLPLVLRGPPSLGAALQSGGIVSVPSPAHPDPAGGNYFRGGFNTRRYGSRDGGTVDGMQIELPFFIREHEHTRRPFLDRLVDWLHARFPTFWGVDLDAAPLVTVRAADPVVVESAGAAAFEVARTGSVALGRTIVMTFSGTATPGADFVALSQIVNFAPGQAVVRLDIDPLDDGVVEGDESIVARVAGGKLVGGSGAVVLILDDDGRPDRPAAWDLDVGAGATAPDVSGNGRDGALEGGATWIAGKVGSALRFDGSDDRLRVSGFDYAGNADAFSLAFWFRTSTGSGDYRYLVSHDSVGSPHSLNVYFVQGLGVLRTSLAFGNDLTDVDVLDVSRPLRDGVWHHYALSADPSGLSHVYIDGEFVVSAHFGGAGYDPSGDLIIGGRSDLDPARFYSGDIDEIGLFSRPITAVDVAGLAFGYGGADAPLPGTREGLELRTGTGGSLSGDVRDAVWSVAAGNQIDASYFASDPARLGAFAGLAISLFPSAAPPAPFPLFQGLHVHAGMVLVDGPRALGPQGGGVSIVLPLNASGISMRMQAIGLAATAANGLFFSSDAHEIRVQ